jgi:hypothetical protein
LKKHYHQASKRWNPNDWSSRADEYVLRFKINLICDRCAGENYAQPESWQTKNFYWDVFLIRHKPLFQFSVRARRHAGEARKEGKIRIGGYLQWVLPGSCFRVTKHQFTYGGAKT